MNKELDPSTETIEYMDELNMQILSLFNQIESKDAEKFEEIYCYHVGSFSKLLRRLLDQYHDETRSINDKTKIKPHILYYREIQQYFVYFVRFPSALYQKNHPYLKELKDLIEQQTFFIKGKYKEKAIQESMLFESDFRDKLELTLKRRQLGDGC